MAAAAARTPSADESTPPKCSASARLGVATRARGSIFLAYFADAPFFISAPPVLDLTTGSATTGAPTPESDFATAEITPELYTMPILTAPISKSDSADSIWRLTHFGRSGSAPAYPDVFWNVTAVTAVRQWSPSDETVLTSPCIPAPEDGSEPPMHSTLRNARPPAPAEYIVGLPGGFYDATAPAWP